MLLFIVCALVMLLSALAVITLDNPIYSALSLIANMLCVAVLFADLNAHFLAVVQVVVYAGAIMVLVMFVLMLLNIKLEPLARGSSMAYSVCAGFLGIVFAALLSNQFIENFAKRADTAHVDLGTVKSIGDVLYTRYLFPFEAASVLIMAGIVGAVLLSKRQQGGKQS